MSQPYDPKLFNTRRREREKKTRRLQIGLIIEQDKDLYVITTSRHEIKYFYSDKQIKWFGKYKYIVFVDLVPNNQEVLYIDELDSFKYVGEFSHFGPDVRESIDLPEKYIVKVSDGCKSRDSYYINLNPETNHCHNIQYKENEFYLDVHSIQENGCEILLEYILSDHNVLPPSETDYLACYHSIKEKISALNIVEIFQSLKAKLHSHEYVRGGRSSFSDEIIGNVGIVHECIYWDNYLDKLIPLKHVTYNYSTPYLRSNNNKVPTIEMYEEWSIEVERANEKYKSLQAEALQHYNQEEHIMHLMHHKLCLLYQNYYKKKIEIERLELKSYFIFNSQRIDSFKRRAYYSKSGNACRTQSMIELIEEH